MKKEIKLLLSFMFVIAICLLVQINACEAKTITGYVWLDDNGNGLMDDGESTLNISGDSHIGINQHKILEEKDVNDRGTYININTDQNGRYTLELEDGIEYYVFYYNANYYFNNAWIWKGNNNNRGLGMNYEMYSRILRERFALGFELVATTQSNGFTTEDIENGLLNIGLQKWEDTPYNNNLPVDEELGYTYFIKKWPWTGEEYYITKDDSTIQQVSKEADKNNEKNEVNEEYEQHEKIQINVKMKIKLTGRVWDDANFNGLLDSGENGIKNVTVVLKKYYEHNSEAIKTNDTKREDMELVTIQKDKIQENADIETNKEEKLKETENIEENDSIEKNEEVQEILEENQNSNLNNSEEIFSEADFFNSTSNHSSETYVVMDAQEDFYNGYDRYITLTDENGNYTFDIEAGEGIYEMYFIYGGMNQLQKFAKYNGHDYEATIVTNMDEVGVTNLGNASYFADKAERRAEVNAYIGGEIGYDMGMKLSAFDKEALEEADLELAENTFMRTESKVFEITGGDVEVGNLNLGLRERKTVDIKTTQYISKLEIILNNGEVLAEAEFDENGNYLNGEKEIQNIMMLPDRISPIIDDDIIHGATVKLTYKVKVESKARGYWENEEEKAEFSRITVYEYLEGGMQAQNVDFRKISESECARLEPVKEINNIYCADIIIGADETKELELVTSMMLTTELDYKFDSSMEMVSYQNTANRRMYNVIPGNYEPEAKTEEELALTEMLEGEEARELETDEAESIRVTIIPPL